MHYRLAVTYGDLRSIPDFAEKTVLAIKAPPDTVLSCDAQEVSLKLFGCHLNTGVTQFSHHSLSCLSVCLSVCLCACVCACALVYASMFSGSMVRIHNSAS